MESTNSNWEINLQSKIKHLLEKSDKNPRSSGYSNNLPAIQKMMEQGIWKYMGKDGVSKFFWLNPEKKSRFGFQIMQKHQLIHAVLLHLK